MVVSISKQKQQLRHQCKVVRRELGDETRRHASQAICARLAIWDVFRASNIILTYMPIGTEVDLRPLLVNFPKNAGCCRVFSPEKMAAWFSTPMIPKT